MVVLLTRVVRGYEPENHAWCDWLCDRDRNGRLVGKDSMTIPLDVLSASGHPYARAAAVILRLRVMHGSTPGRHAMMAFWASSRRIFRRA